LSKLRITAVGTCRIHTPLRRAAGRYPIDVDHRRNYGFVHTSDEALQLVRFLQGEKQFRPEVAPLVIREGRLADYEAESWQPADLHIVEISSAKRMTSLGDSVQSNYLAHHFADFFAHPGRSRTFWSLVKKAHRQQLVRFLEKEETYQLLSPADRELLTTLQMEPQSFKAIKTDMAEIVDRLGGDKLLFLTHVNAAGADGEPIAQRDRLIRWVKMAAEQLGVPVFDPTAAMNDFGQEKALESGGLDLTHYTPAFYDRLYDEIHRAHVVPLIGSGDGFDRLNEADEQAAKRAAQLEAMLEHSDFVAASREVHAAVDDRPGALPLVELRGLIRSRIGDFRGAVEDLTRRGDDGALSQGMRVGLVEALAATGDNERALEVAEKLFREEYESAALYKAAAAAAETLGKTDVATAYAKQAFRRDRTDLGAALHALMLLGESRSPAEVSAWRQEILENISDSASGALEISIWSIRNRDDELFAAALKAVAPVDKAGTVDLLEDAFDAGMVVGVARSITVAAALGRIPRGMSERRLAVIERTLAKAQEVAEDDPAGSFEIARGLLPLEHIESSQIPGRQLARQAVRLIRKLSQQVRIAVREAYNSGDSAAVLCAGESAGALLFSLPDAASIYARTLHSNGRVEDALNVMKRIRARGADDFVVTRWTARLAALAGDHKTALQAYGELRRSKDAGLAKIREEVNRFFATAGKRALKELRSLVLDGQHEQALALAALIRTEVGEEERVERELQRLHSLLRRRLREIEEGDSDPQEREIALRRLADVAPNDARNLRKLASHLMRNSRYAEAAEVWERIHRLDPADEKAEIQRERCARMAKRRVAAWNEDLEAA
jgi:tetratricopeptide (TPR) repeat protein